MLRPAKRTNQLSIDIELQLAARGVSPLLYVLNVITELIEVIAVQGRVRRLQLDDDDAAPTIRTGFLNPSRGRFLHPEEDRPISFREGARLQMVPDEFQFDGTAVQMARQIGNAVPVGVGRCMARAVSALVG